MLENITLLPAPWKAEALPVPKWQIEVFRRPDLVKRMRAADELLGGDEAVEPDDENATKASATKLKAQQKNPDSAKPRPAAGEPPSKVNWQSNIDAFDMHLGKLLSEARIPDKEALVKRITAIPGGGGFDSEVMPITDGAGGFVDLKPAKGTVQFRVNEALKGQAEKWEFELASDASPNYLGLMMLQPKLAGGSDVNEAEGSVAFLNTIILKTPTTSEDQRWHRPLGCTALMKVRGIEAVFSESGLEFFNRCVKESDRIPRERCDRVEFAVRFLDRLRPSAAS